MLICSWLKVEISGYMQMCLLNMNIYLTSSMGIISKTYRVALI